MIWKSLKKNTVQLELNPDDLRSMGNAIQEIETASPSVLREGNGLAASLRKLKRIYNALFGGVVESVIELNRDTALPDLLRGTEQPTAARSLPRAAPELLMA